MASLNVNVENTPSRRGQLGNWFLTLIEQAAQLSGTYRKIQYYNSLSDSELARMGMTRRDVVEKVFGGRAQM